MGGELELSKKRRVQAPNLDLVLNIGIVMLCIASIFPLCWLFSGSIKYSGDIMKIPPDWIPARVFRKHPQDFLPLIHSCLQMHQ